MFAIFVERSDARQEAVIRFVVLQKSVARVIHEDLLATTGEYYLPYRRVKAMIELDDSKLVDRALKMTSTAVVHQQQCMKKTWKKWVIW